MQALANAAVPAAGKKKGFISFYTKGEEIFNAVSHIVGGALGVVALIVGVLLSYPDPIKIVGTSVFAVSVIILYTMSSLYHFLPNGVAKGVFRVFDHCTIFLLIAGTYTPFCLIVMRDTAFGLPILIGEWILAAAGITMNAIAMKKKAVIGISMVLYVVMGWAVAVSFPVLVNAVSTACFLLLFAGGVAYTAGIAFFALGSKVKYFHSVWHLFDLEGKILHFSAILLIL